jgi:hypothetical protein
MAKQFINPDSARYVERPPYMPHGSDGKEYGHKLGWGLYNAIGTHQPGRPLENTTDLYAAMRGPSNLHLKYTESNRQLDERRDARIAAAYADGSRALKQFTTAERAYQAYKGGMGGDATMKHRAAIIGQMTYHSGGVGRPTKIKNLH